MGAAPPNDFFSPEATFTGVLWEDIHGTSATNIFAVGSTAGALSAIAYRGSGTWVLQTVPNVGPLKQVWVLSPTFAIATPAPPSETGGVPQYLKWNGATWSAVNFGTTFTESGVWGLSTTDYEFWHNSVPTSARWAHSTGGAIIMPDVGCTGGFTQGIPTTSDVFAIGSTYYRYDHITTGNLAREAITSPYTVCTTTGLTFGGVIRDLWSGTGSTSGLWAVGNGGLIIRDATPATSPTTNNLDSIWGVSATDFWAVGDQGTVIHGDGTNLLLEATTTASNLRGVYCSAVSVCWTVAQDGTIAKLVVVPVTALPSIAGLNLDDEDVRTMVSHSQCLGDPVTYSGGIDKTLGAGGIHFYVIDTSTNLVVEHRTNLVVGDLMNLNNLLFYRDVTLPNSEYLLVVTADYSGVLEQDEYAFESFSVPHGPCTDVDSLDLAEVYSRLSSISDRLNTTCQKGATLTVDCEGVNNHLTGALVYRSSQTNGYVNATDAHLTGALVYRTNQTNTYVNQTRMDVMNLTNLILGNLTIGNLTINGTGLDSLIREVFIEQSVPIADAIRPFLWVAVVALAWALVRWGESRLLGAVVFGASIFVGIGVFPGSGLMLLVSVGVGVLGMLWASRKVDE